MVIHTQPHVNTLHAGSDASIPIPLPASQTLIEMILSQAVMQPSHSAVVSTTSVLTYQQLAARSISLAKILQENGCTSNSIVAIYVERSPDLIVALVGTMLAGGAYVVLDPAYPQDRIKFMLEDADPVAIVTQTHLIGHIPANEKPVIDIAMVPENSDLPPPAYTRQAHAAVYMIYTSGSTGQPKGVLVSNANLITFVHWYCSAFHISPNDRVAQLVSPAFDVLGLEVWPTLAQGATLHIPDAMTRVNAHHLQKWIIEQGITVTAMTAALAEQLIALTWPDTTTLRILHSGGDSLHTFVPENLPFTVVNNYGPTETTIEVTYGIVPAIGSAITQLPTLGMPVPYASIYILNDDLQPVEPGTIGEIVIGGAGVAIGYHNRPELTQERFVRDPFASDPDARMYRTGDLVYQLANGEFMFAGRMDDQIKLRGYRIESGEIIYALNLQPGIRQSAVALVSSDHTDAQLVAYVVPDTDQTPLSPLMLQAALQQILPDYMIPTLFARIDQLPLTPNGKIDRTALPPITSDNILQDTAQQEDLSFVEAQLIAVVAPLLHRETVILDDNFFMLGGHSLLGTQLITRIRSTFDVSLSLRTLFNAPTIRELAHEIEELILQQMERTHYE